MEINHYLVITCGWNKEFFEDLKSAKECFNESKKNDNEVKLIKLSAVKVLHNYKWKSNNQS